MKDNPFLSQQLSSIIIILSNMNDKLKTIEEEICKQNENTKVLDEQTHLSMNYILNKPNK